MQDVPDVQDVPNVQDSIDVPGMKVVSNVQNVPGVQDVPNVQDSIDVPGTTAHNIFNTKSPEDGLIADKSKTKKIAMPATTSGERGAGGITKCAPTCVTGNFATCTKATTSSSQRQRYPFI
jgi:hypothetical protein